MGNRFRKTRDLLDRLPKLFESNLTLGKWLGSIIVVGENWEDFILVAAKMSVAWRDRGKMAQLCTMRCGIHPSPSPPPFLEQEKKDGSRVSFWLVSSYIWCLFS